MEIEIVVTDLLIHIMCYKCNEQYQAKHHTIPIWNECPVCGERWPFKVIGVLPYDNDQLPELYSGGSK